MARVVVTARVADIIVYLTEKAGILVATRYRNDLDAAYDRLAGFPGAGSPRKALGRDARIVLVYPYVIVYDHVGDTVTILRVLHCRRNITRRLVRRTER